jgi:hypothetical protein
MSGYLLHHMSCEATKSELDLLTIPPTQVSIVDNGSAQYFPISSTENQQVIDFHIPGNENFIDPSKIYLYLQIDIKKNGGTNISETDEAIPVNGLLHSMFSDVIVQIGDKIITSTDQEYPYKAYFSRLFMENSHAIESYLNMEMFYNEPKFEKLTTEILQNEKIKQKRKRCSKNIEMVGRLCIGLFDQDRFLPNDLDLRIKLIRQKNEFCMIVKKPDPAPSTEGRTTTVSKSEVKVDTYSIGINKISLFVKKVELNPDVKAKLIKANSLGTFKYPMFRTEVRTQCLTQGSRDIHLNNMFLGSLPCFLLFGLVDNEAHAGSFSTNPFYFHNKNINYVSIQVDNRQYPLVPLQPDFPNSQFILCYQQLLQSIGKYYNTDGLNLTLDDYANGSTLFAFDLTGDENININHFNLSKNGTLGINIKLGEALDKPMTLIAYVLFQSIVELQKDRKVIVDF